jgi:hypothetical protein
VVIVEDDRVDKDDVEREGRAGIFATITDLDNNS